MRVCEREGEEEGGGSVMCVGVGARGADAPWLVDDTATEMPSLYVCVCVCDCV